MIEKKSTRKLLTGGEAVAYAEMQINPEVCAVYPITPQTPIIETFAKYVSNGKCDTELILAESEHSALSACVGASASGVRTFTATSSQGLALMLEIVYITSGLRLPVVMAVGNRALSAPINIHCDHSDSFMVRDAGWIQIYCKDPQEAYDTMFIAQRLAEKVDLPVMVMQDGFYTTHSLQPVSVLEDKTAKSFVGKKPKKENLLDNKISIGNFALQDSYFETRVQLFNAMEKIRNEILTLHKEFYLLSGRKYALFDSYCVKDAEIVFVVLNSTCSAFIPVVDEFRRQGKKIGLLRPRFLRPFPFVELKKELVGKTVVAVDRNTSFGTELSPLGLEFNGLGKEIYNVVYGLGGRDFVEEDAKKLVKMFLEEKKKQPKFQFYGVNKNLLK